MQNTLKSIGELCHRKTNTVFNWVFYILEKHGNELLGGILIFIVLFTLSLKNFFSCLWMRLISIKMRYITYLTHIWIWAGWLTLGSISRASVLYSTIASSSFKFETFPYLYIVRETRQKKKKKHFFHITSKGLWLV